MTFQNQQDYSSLAPEYIFLAKLIKENNYSICGNVSKLCIKGPWNERQSNDYLIEIRIPVKEL